MGTVPPAVARPVDLYHLAFSQYCEKARRILEYKAIPFRVINVPYGHHDDVLRVSQQDYVPIICTADGATITWRDIPDWAEALAPTPTIYPAGRGLAQIVDHWAHNVIDEWVWQLVLPDLSGTIADPHERWTFEEVQLRARGPMAYVAMRRDDILAMLCSLLAMVEESLSASPFLFGPAPSLADFALYGALRPIELVGGSLPAQFSRLRTWYSRTATD